MQKNYLTCRYCALKTFAIIQWEAGPSQKAECLFKYGYQLIVADVIQLYLCMEMILFLFCQ